MIFYKKKKVIWSLIFWIVISYLIFHVIKGERGVIAYFKLTNGLKNAELELDHIRAERIELEHKVKLLKPPIDLDMLDEQARRVLGVAKQSEKVFIVENASEDDVHDKTK